MVIEADIIQIICVGSLVGFIVFGFLAPIIAQMFHCIWAFINDAKIRDNIIHDLYFIKILNCTKYDSYSNPYREGKLWFSYSYNYDYDEYYFHHVLHSVIAGILAILALNVPIASLIIIFGTASVFAARTMVRTGKKISTFKQNLDSHIADKSAHS